MAAVAEMSVADIRAILAENATAIKENRIEWLERQKEAEERQKRVDESIDKMSQRIDSLRESVKAWGEHIDKWVGFTGNSIGNMVELILIPGIKKKMNEFGHQFNSMCPRKQYYRKDGRTFVEVDLFLENGDEVMAVEVKTQLSVKEVDHHLKRLQLLRKHEAESGLKGKTLLAGVAGLNIDAEARDKALELGMYIIEMIEDEKNINVIKPNGKLGMW